MTRTHDNPYRSPETVGREVRPVSGRSLVADLALLGLVYGGTIGAATGVTAVIGWLGWSVLTISEAAPTDHLAAVEAVVGAAIARVFLGGCLGAVVGAMLGPVAGWLAATDHLGLRRHLKAFTAATSALAGIACVLLLWHLTGRSEVSQQFDPPVVMLAWAVAVSAIGGGSLGRTLRERAEAPFSTAESEVQ